MRLQTYQDKLRKTIKEYTAKKAQLPPHRAEDVFELRKIIDASTSVPSLTFEIVEYLNSMITGLCIPTGRSILKSTLLKAMNPVIKGIQIEKLEHENNDLRRQVANMQTQLNELIELQSKIIHRLNHPEKETLSTSKIEVRKEAKLSEVKISQSETVVLSEQEYQDLIEQLCNLSQQLTEQDQPAKTKLTHLTSIPEHKR